MKQIPFSVPTICNKPHVDILKKCALESLLKTGHWIETPCILARSCIVSSFKNRNYLGKVTQSELNCPYLLSVSHFIICADLWRHTDRVSKVTVNDKQWLKWQRHWAGMRMFAYTWEAWHNLSFTKIKLMKTIIIGLSSDVWETTHHGRSPLESGDHGHCWGVQETSVGIVWPWTLVPDNPVVAGQLPTPTAGSATVAAGRCCSRDLLLHAHSADCGQELRVLASFPQEVWRWHRERPGYLGIWGYRFQSNN